MTLSLILLVAACLCFFVAALPVPARIPLVPLGLFLWVLSILVGGGVHLHG